MAGSDPIDLNLPWFVRKSLSFVALVNGSTISCSLGWKSIVQLLWMSWCHILRSSRQVFFFFGWGEGEEEEVHFMLSLSTPSHHSLPRCPMLQFKSLSVKIVFPTFFSTAHLAQERLQLSRPVPLCSTDRNISRWS